ncbi:hypothetical protein [Paenibacillus xanthanilyticus]|uniref:Uncharacterized protein n=1 Tax=Paenibacillus xanthanilyticus TaxID=1783531 RepID=A0ABV8K6N3_9BACL
MKKSAIGAAVLLTGLVVFISAAYAVGDNYQPVKQTPETETAYVTNLNGNHLTTDAIQWYEGQDADRIFLEREPDSGLDAAPDGYYIVNDDESIRTISVDPDAQVLMQIYDKTGNPEDLDVAWNESISFKEFADALNKSDVLDLKSFPYHLTIENGVVTKIVQQYVP